MNRLMALLTPALPPREERENCLSQRDRPYQLFLGTCPLR